VLSAEWKLFIQNKANLGFEQNHQQAGVLIPIWKILLRAIFRALKGTLYNRLCKDLCPFAHSVAISNNVRTVAHGYRAVCGLVWRYCPTPATGTNGCIRNAI
jgi:hypothetical protein